MKQELEELIKIKIAISLNKLLKARKVSVQDEDGKDNTPDTYNKIALFSDLRKATVSDTFNAKSIPSSATLILIVEAMGFDLIEFSKVYCSIKENEISDFISSNY
ncbi:hypothetical protein [Flavisericum labens]|uniref:hypothetical protein n=1 Tax=Flavisericum labens TaxID=3377112 RepID=UPI00387AE72F